MDQAVCWVVENCVVSVIAQFKIQELNHGCETVSWLS
jgi:hypothetical protein